MLQKIGVKGQKRIMAAKVLIIGLGALGSPVVQYLAAAGVGTIGIVDFDEVSLGNLQSQVIHSTRDIHRPKTASARTYHVGDAVPLEGDSFKYPEYFDIISLENNGVVLIRGGQIQDIIKLQDYYFTGLPVLDERGFALIIKNQKDLEEFLKEYDRTEGKNVSEFHNKWFRFETYRKIVCTDNFWMI
ncbi:MAG: HesA/MoeB/ThiF family protein [Blautia sp.]